MSNGGPVVSNGGGFGGSINPVGGNGGSGGGSRFDRAGPNDAGRGTPGQGNDGGISDRTAFGAGGGGGGAGEVGGIARDEHLGGDGGDGVESNITGTPLWVGGGGGAGVNDNFPNPQVVPGGGGAGGRGGGGNGSSLATPFNGVPQEGCFIGSDGVPNTGGGGGGTDPECTFAGNGGSGIVVLRYQSAEPILFGGSVSSLDGYIIHTFADVGESNLTYPFECFGCQFFPVHLSCSASRLIFVGSLGENVIRLAFFMSSEP